MKVFIDSGHGGTIFGVPQTAGKRSPDLKFGFIEGENNRIMAHTLGEELGLNFITLENGYCDICNYSSVDIPMSARVSAVNSACGPDDIYLGLHTNAASKGGEWQTRASGARIIYQSRFGVESKKSKKLAEFLFDGWPHRNGAQIRSPHGQNLYMLRKTKCRSLIVEVGFHDNREDVEWIRNGGFDSVAEHIARKLEVLK